jgi:hypothetical protein
MKMTRNRVARILIGLSAALVIVVGLSLPGSRSSAAVEPAEQVIFSGVGFADDGDWAGPVGFWIWCIDEGTGPYAENNVCTGAMYVYSQALTKGVHGTVEENPDDSYTMTVSANDGSTFSAELTNATLPVQRGPNNTVEFTVTTPAGTSSGSSDNSVVRVTGPGD